MNLAYLFGSQVFDKDSICIIIWGGHTENVDTVISNSNFIIQTVVFVTIIHHAVLSLIHTTKQPRTEAEVLNLK